MEKAALDLEIQELQQWAFKGISWWSATSLTLQTLEGLSMRLSFPPLTVTSPLCSRARETAHSIQLGIYN